MIIADIFRDRIFNRKLVGLALPITLQSLMLALVAAADAVMLGKVSQDAMASVSLATQIQFVQNMLLAAIATGVGILGAQYWGKKILRYWTNFSASASGNQCSFPWCFLPDALFFRNI